MVRTPDKQNATMLVRHALPLNDLDTDYPALMLANCLLGQAAARGCGSASASKGGLSYDVGSGVDWNQHEPNSIWEASAIFAPQNRAKVETAFREEVSRALKEGFTQRELAEAKKGLLSPPPARTRAGRRTWPAR